VADFHYFEFNRLFFSLVGGAGASASTLCDVVDDVGDYEIDSQSTGSGSEQLTSTSAMSSAARVQAVPTATSKPPPPSAAGRRGPPTRRKRRFDTLPARDVQVRRAKMQRYRFEKRTHRKVLHVLPTSAAFDLRDTAASAHCDVSPCQVK